MLMSLWRTPAFHARPWPGDGRVRQDRHIACMKLTSDGISERHSHLSRAPEARQRATNDIEDDPNETTFAMLELVAKHQAPCVSLVLRVRKRILCGRRRRGYFGVTYRGGQRLANVDFERNVRNNCENGRRILTHLREFRPQETQKTS